MVVAAATGRRAAAPALALALALEDADEADEDEADADRRCGRRFDPSKGIKMSCTHVGERVLEWRGECVLESARGARITYRCVGYCVIF